MYFYGYRQHQPHAFVNKLAKGAYLKFINKLIMGHIEIFSYTNTHIHPITHIRSL